MTELAMWTIYDHPFDQPDQFVARRWVIDADGGPRPGTIPGDLLVSTTLDVLREQMMLMGLTCLARSPEDDPVIVETWI